MSNARNFPNTECRPRSRSRSPTRTASTGGASTTPFASSTRSFMRSSSVKAANSGEPMQSTTRLEAGSLAEWMAAPDYLDRIGAIVERIAAATAHATVQMLLSEGARALGAESAAFVNFVHAEAEISSCRLMLACDPAWCRQYLDAGTLARDPWLVYAARHSEPIIASPATFSDPDRRAAELAVRSGFTSAVLVPAHSGAGHTRVSLLCLGSSTPGYFEADGFGRFKLGARALACELHEWWLARIRRELIVRARITPSDLDLLRHQSQGHSSKRIAAELHVSGSSINSRFQRMNNKLGVRNRKMAVRLVSECGLLPT
jgi:DNA-binding CsgD family transcriptional regulator